MDPAVDEFAQVRDLMPEQAIPVMSMRYVRYLNPEDGESYFKWHFDGNQHLSMTVGDLFRIIQCITEDDETVEDD